MVSANKRPNNICLYSIDLDASTRPPRYPPRDVDCRPSSRRDRRIGASVAGGYRGGCCPERREAPLEAGRAGKLIQTLEGHAPGAAAACMDAVLDKMHRGGGGYSGGPPVSSAAWVRGRGEDSRERPPESHRYPVKPPPPGISVKQNAANPAVRPPPDGCQQDDNKPGPRPKKAPPPLPDAAWTERSGLGQRLDLPVRVSPSGG